MLSKIVSIFLFISYSFILSTSGQKTNKLNLEFNGSADFALNEGDPLPGLGSQLKLLIPVGFKNSVFTVGLGIDRLYDEFEFDAYTYNFEMASFGYRKRITSVFIEPKVGFGIDIESGSTSPCGFIGLEPGMEKKKFIFSLEYRFISSDGLVEGDHFHTLSLKVGYKIF